MMVKASLDIEKASCFGFRHSCFVTYIEHRGTFGRCRPCVAGTWHDIERQFSSSCFSACGRAAATWQFWRGAGGLLETGATAYRSDFEPDCSADIRRANVR